MRMALTEIEREQGQPAKALPGGFRTVNALMRRGRVEIDNSKDARVFLPEHEHQFMRGMHLDGCHYFADVGKCDCGVSYHSRIERNVSFDPYSAIWMESDGEEPCERCMELLAGARPRVDVAIVRQGNGA